MNCQHCNGTNIEKVVDRDYCLDCEKPATNEIACHECGKITTVHDDGEAVTVVKACNECYIELLEKIK